MYGDATGGTGYGIFGRASGGTGYGVYGHATDGIGIKYGIFGKTESSNGWAGYFEGKGYFSDKVGIGTTAPAAELEVKGDVILGETGTRFLEIREISGTTGGTGSSVMISNALPSGWTGNDTRVLSLEIQWDSDTGNWVTTGAGFINAVTVIFAALGYNTRWLCFSIKQQKLVKFS